MCLAIVYFDPAAPYPFAMLETRDENIHRLHGASALKAIGRSTASSYGAHWQCIDAIRNLPILHADPAIVLDAEIFGGFDMGQGTWVALSLKNAIAAKLLVAEFPDGGLGETNNPRVRAAKFNHLVTRTGLCLAACAFRSVDEVIDRLPRLLAETFRNQGIEMLPFRLVLGGAGGAYVLHYQGHGSSHVTPLPERKLSVISTMGINDPRSKITTRLLRMLDKNRQNPTPERKDGWEVWLSACQFRSEFSDEEATPPAVPYRHPSWRAFEYSVYQPPYVAGHGPNAHMRPVGPGTFDAPIEWTCSSTCIAISQHLPPIFLAEERRPIDASQALPKSLCDVPFPSGPADFTRISTTF